MRTIKFRGKDVFTDAWRYGDLVHNQKVTTTGLEPRTMVGGYEVDHDTVGQYTGLKDKNGMYCCNDEMTVREYENNRFVVPRNFSNLSWEDEPVRVTLSLEPEVIASDDATTN